MFIETILLKHRKGLIILGLIAIAGHSTGVAADIFSGYAPGVDAQLGPITSLSLDNIAPLFVAKSLPHARLGHYLAIIFIPFGLTGILMVFLGLAPSENKLAYAFLAMGGLGIIYATFYHGTLAFIIGALQQSSIEFGSSSGVETRQLVCYFNSLSEPLGQVLLIADMLVSCLFAFIVLRKKTHYPKWMAVYNPVVIQLALYISFLIAPHPLNQLIWLTVFNVSMVVWFVGLTIVLARGSLFDG